MTKFRPPSFLMPLSSDEYAPQPYSQTDRAVIAGTLDQVGDSAKKRNLTPRQLNGGKLATAAGLLAINREWKDAYYRIDRDAAIDDDAAAEQLRGQGIVIDVQTHFMAPHSARMIPAEGLKAMYRAIMPEWWKDMDEIVAWNLSDYVTNVFLKSETAVAVLTSGPGMDDSRNLFNDEIAATRALIDTLGARGRLLNHAVVHADVPAEMAAMAEWKEQYDPVGWKVYTPGRLGAEGWTDGWMLDDEEYGFPFLERARALGVRLICAHKGISMLADNGSPRDIGPAAKAFPDLNFVVYHSGYEFPIGEDGHEGPYAEATRALGVNRLISASLDAGLSAGANIFPELGSTWFSLVRRPVDAAHVLGKLIAHFGEDNVIWGTDSIWYGSAQPIIDAFRAFQIPDAMCERFGYAPLTPLVKEKILSRNAARIYGIDLAAAAYRAENDDLAWARQIADEYRRGGYDFLH